MGIFDRFKKAETQAEPKAEPKAEPATARDTEQPAAPSPPLSLPASLPVVCYRIAYTVLPQMLFADAQRLIAFFTNPDVPVGANLYVMAAQTLDIEPNREDALAFHTHAGELEAGTNYYVLEYPVPPPVDLTGIPILAPFFSAILLKQATGKASTGQVSSGQISYFTLGQSPFQGTTLRRVTADGINANLGPGPAPELNAFLEALRAKL